MKIVLPRTEIDGRSPRVEDLLIPALVNYGHITVMQVRDRAVRGLGLHLGRLDAANRGAVWRGAGRRAGPRPHPSRA